MTETELIAQYGNLTIDQILRLYVGPDALECPPELVPWLEVAIKVSEVDALEREVRVLRASNAQRRMRIASLLPVEFADWTGERILAHLAAGKRLDPRLLAFIDAAREFIESEDAASKAS